MTKQEILDHLTEVKDPEIPVLSIIDLGVITNVEISGADVQIEMTPTFTGCPAIDVMKFEIAEVLKKHGAEKVDVTISFREPWTSDRLTENGRAALAAFGLAPPPLSAALFQDLDILEHAICPRCNGTNTDMRSPFGSTLCRSIYFCNQCRESFEQFKAI